MLSTANAVSLTWTLSKWCLLFILDAYCELIAISNFGPFVFIRLMTSPRKNLTSHGVAGDLPEKEAVQYAKEKLKIHSLTLLS